MIVGEVKRATQDGELHFVVPDSDGVCVLCLQKVKTSLSPELTRHCVTLLLNNEIIFPL